MTDFLINVLILAYLILVIAFVWAAVRKKQ